MPTLNLGILAHVDAGKTTLTERLLHDAGLLDHLGSVDDGTTVTDSMELERRRGITIRTAVATLAVGDATVNLVDTPGHPDFIAEVERALTVLDGAVLVLSAVEGVQPQTVVLWRALRRLRVPTVLFVNKVDRSGADPDGVVAQVRRRLDPHAVALSTATGAGSADASVHAVGLDDRSVVEQVADVDDPLLERWVGDRPLRAGEVRDALRSHVACCDLSPVLVGSAVTGAGVDLLRAAVVDLLPPAGDRSDEPSGVVFAVAREAGTRHALVRLWSGRVGVRDRLALDGRRPERVTALRRHDPGGLVPVASATAGQIVSVTGLTTARVGDRFGPSGSRPVHRFPPATLEAVVEPVDPTRRMRLHDALAELADLDPLIGLRTDDARQEITVRLFGEVQKEVIAALLLEQHGVEARFRDTTVVHVEQVWGPARRSSAWARTATRTWPGSACGSTRPRVGHGVEFRPGLEPGRLVASFLTATQEAVRASLAQGPHGWDVPDAVVTMTASQYLPRQSHSHQRFDKAMSSIAADFRHLAPVALARALAAAGTRVCEPVHRFELEVPEAVLAATTALLGRLGGVLDGTRQQHDRTTLTGTVPAASLRALTGRLPDLARGEAVLVTGPDHHRPVAGPRAAAAPDRPGSARPHGVVPREPSLSNGSRSVSRRRRPRGRARGRRCRPTCRR